METEKSVITTAKTSGKMNRYFITGASATFLLLLIITACKDEERCSIHPEAFRFSLVAEENGSDLLATGIYDPEAIELYYFHENERQDLIVNKEQNPESLVVLYSSQLPMISLTGRSDTFYLALNSQETDTLFVVVERDIREDCDYHPYTLVKLNGRNIPVVEGEAFIFSK